MEALKDFEVAENNPFDRSTLLTAVQYVASMHEHLDEEMLNILVLLHPEYEDDNEEIDLPSLVKSQLKSAIALKNSYFNRKTGRLLDGHAAREAKDALASVQQVLNTLIKQQDSLDHQDKLLKMENVLIHCLDEEDEGLRDRVLDHIHKQVGEL